MMMDPNVWSLTREVEGGRLKVKALALRGELEKYGLTTEESVRKSWERAIMEVEKKSNGCRIRIVNVKFLNVYCLVEMEAHQNGSTP